MALKPDHSWNCKFLLITHSSFWVSSKIRLNISARDNRPNVPCACCVVKFGFRHATVRFSMASVLTSVENLSDWFRSSDYDAEFTAIPAIVVKNWENAFVHAVNSPNRGGRVNCTAALLLNWGKSKSVLLRVFLKPFLRSKNRTYCVRFVA